MDKRFLAAIAAAFMLFGACLLSASCAAGEDTASGSSFRILGERGERFRVLGERFRVLGECGGGFFGFLRLSVLGQRR